MKITTGKQKKPQRVVVYGVEGIGKTTFAAKFPKPLFLDTEGSTDTYDVNRVEIKSYQDLQEAISFLLKSQGEYQTVVIDTADWAEKFFKRNICQSHNKKSIEDFSYGKGYVHLGEAWERFLEQLTKLNNAGYHVVVTAHAQMRKFEQPDEEGSYDRYELKLTGSSKYNLSAMTKEWADMVLFANHQVIVEKSEGSNKAKARSKGKRVMYTTHHASWDAKNRFGLEECLPFNFDSIKHCLCSEIPQITTSETEKEVEKVEVPEAPTFEGKKPTPPTEEKKVSKYPEDTNAFNAGLYTLMDRDGITEDQIHKYFEVQLVPKNIITANTTVHNIPQQLAEKLVRLWDTKILPKLKQL